MKTIFALTGALALLLMGLVGQGSSKPTVSSIHAFEEPLVAVGGNKTTDYDGALLTALQAYQSRKSYEDVSALTNYLASNPQSPWKFSLLSNLGMVYRKTGFYSKAIDAWEQAWNLGKEEKDLRIQALADRVAAELATLLSSLGRTERLISLENEIKGRVMYGSANTMMMSAKENVWLMKNKPGTSFKCGPYALNSIRSFADKTKAHDPLVLDAQSSPKGFSLVQVKDLADKLKMNYQMVKRDSGSEIIVPSVVHWKSGHYAALLKKIGDQYLTQDPTFGHELLVSIQALEDESSGYFLIPSGTLPSGWHAITNAEGSTVWGRGLVSNRSPATKPNDKKCACSGDSHGMAVYNVLAMMVSLRIQDTPVGYSPVIGPDMHFTVTYNQLESDQPSTFTFSNFGPSWNFAWLSYVTIPTSSGGTALINLRGGGQETYSSYTNTGSTYPGYAGYYGRDPQSLAALWVTTSSPPTYERRMPDGSKEVFAQPSSSASPVYMFLTSIIDPQGNASFLGYDTTSSYYLSTGNLRLLTITDAMGLATTLTYGFSSDPLKITQITDPYARSATFVYSTAAPYQLSSITDVIGIKSSFTYGSGSAITQMTTPYGTTAFAYSTSGTTHTLNVTEPDSSQVHAESILDGTHYPYNGSPEPVPSGHGFGNYTGASYLVYRNTYYWDKKAMSLTGNNPDSDYTKAYIYHFLHTSNGSQESPILESEKPALENRTWYTYPGNTTIYAGASAQPTFMARYIDSSNSQVWQYQYANSANPATITAAIDPAGRQTNYTYDTPTGIDLMTVTQTTGTSSSATLQTLAYAGPPHRPTSITDAAGKTTTYAYNSQGQITSVTPPVRAGQSAEPTTYNYTSNYLTSVTGPLSGATKTMTYDSLNGHTLNRVRTMADAETFTLTYSYDNLDRPTQTLYPDGTTDTFSYVNPATNAYGVAGAVDLDLHSSKDRLNRSTTRSYDSVRHLTSITDPKNQTTHYGWCSCGSMISLTDPNGNLTNFNRDVESRITSKTYAGETNPPASPQYVYDSLGRVSTYSDKRGDGTTYSYNLDNTVASINYSNVSGTVSTPSESYGYDTYYPRLTSIGGVGITYYNPGSLGALKPQVITNTLTGGSAAITYGYDEWGRVVSRNIDGANAQSTVFDALGRISSISNLLGSFTYSYFDPTHPTNRIGSIRYPSGQGAYFDYLGNTGDERLKEITNVTSFLTVLSVHDYTYDAMGKIQTWQQVTDNNTPLLWSYGYDSADQLTSAVQTSTAITTPALRNDSYGYDAAGNALTFNISGVARSPGYNALNQLTGSTPSGNRSVGFSGTVNGPDTVTINGTAAPVNGANAFAGTVSLVPGSTNTVTIKATDVQGNSRTNKYQTVAPTEPSYSPTYDADGNELTNGAGQSYKWDVKNQLATITYASGASTVLTYDALGHRIGIVEKTSGGTVTSTKQFVWDGDMMAEERDASNAVARRFYTWGEKIGSTAYYYAKDHLGSIREMTDSANAVQARYDYDPYGRVTTIIGTVPSDFQYAGYYEHTISGLNLTKYRAYDPTVGRWLSRDPIDESSDATLYSYVLNNPIVLVDPFGLSGWQTNIYSGVYSSTNDPNNNNQNDAHTGQPADPNSDGAALPYSGPLESQCIEVYNPANGKSTVVPVKDVGPHHTDDNYWDTNSRPKAESEGGNKAGLDLTPSVHQALGTPVKIINPGTKAAEWVTSGADPKYNWRFVKCPCKN